MKVYIVIHIDSCSYDEIHTIKKVFDSKDKAEAYKSINNPPEYIETVTTEGTTVKSRSYEKLIIEEWELE